MTYPVRIPVDYGDDIEARRALADQRRFAARHRDEIDAAWTNLPDGRPAPLTRAEKARADCEWNDL